MNEQRGYFIRNIKLFWLMFILFVLPYSLFSQQSVSFNDTIINRGVVSQLPIYGSFPKILISKLEIIIEFDAILLDVKSIIAGESFIMNCPKPDFKINMDEISKTSMTISCDDINNIQSGIICLLNIEGLAGPDSLTVIKPVKIIINGAESDNYNLIPGQITIPGIPVFQTYPENIGNNYPNPFFEETRFPISIHEPTKVKFYIYTSDGRFILSNEQPNNMLKLSFYRNKQEIPISDLNEKLEQGFYILKLSPDNMRFASGEYYLIMVTKLGTYYKNFMYFK